MYDTLAIFFVGLIDILATVRVEEKHKWTIKAKVAEFTVVWGQLSHDVLTKMVGPASQESERVLDHSFDKGGFETKRHMVFSIAIDVTHFAEEFNKRFPHHLAMMRQAENLIIDGNYAFIHAGVRPNVSLKDQRDKDLRWIRGEFLNHTDAHEKIVVHGHTVTASRRPEVYSNRIALDTGAYEIGTLSAAVIAPRNNTGQTNFLQAFAVQRSLKR